MHNISNWNPIKIKIFKLRPKNTGGKVVWTLWFVALIAIVFGFIQIIFFGFGQEIINPSFLLTKSPFASTNSFVYWI